MPWYQYIEVHKDLVEADMQSHYKREIQQVRAFGFNEEFYICEKRFPFSVILDFDVIRGLAAKGILWRRGSLYRLLVYSACLIHEDGYVYAAILKNRVKFVTMFDDHTIVQTCSFRGNFMRGSSPDRSYILQICRSGNIADTWAMHQSRVKQMAEQGRTVMPIMSMQDASRIERRTDEIQIYGYAKPWRTHEKSKAKRVSAL
jgi:hypothetical protein